MKARAHKLNLARNAFLKYARRHPCSPKAVQAVMLADAIEESIDRQTLLETQLRTADQAVQALVADDKALRQQVADLTAANAAKDQQIAALQANSITDTTLADVNTLVPEPPAPPTDGQPA
jgi:septal ring factor EnvC (AmiA/AmiB activator)